MPYSRNVWRLGTLLSHLIAPAFLLAQDEVARDRFGGPPRFQQRERTGLTAGRDAVWSGHLNLGLSYLEISRFAEAESQFRSGLVIAETFAPDDLRRPDTLTWLAQALTQQGKYTEAETIYRRALAIYERVCGPSHQAIANALGALASNQHRKGEYAEAERLYKQSLVMFEKTVGEKSLRVAQVLGHLATLNSMHGRFVQAEPYRKRALAIYEATVSRDNPSLLGNLLDLAFIYRKQGKNAEAESQYKKALALLENVRGPDDPKVAELLVAYASLLKTMGRAAEAEGLQIRPEAIRKKQARPLPFD